MTPSTLEALALLVVAVLPGATYAWAFERRAGPFGVNFADRALRFLAASLVLHLLFGWLEYGVWRWKLEGEDAMGAGQFGALWLGSVALFVASAGAGTVVGGLYATRDQRGAWPLVRRLSRLSGTGGSGREDRLLRLVVGRKPAPRAWDHFFAHRPECLLRVWTSEADYVVGRFSTASYAGGFPHERDLYLEELYGLGEHGEIGEGLGYPLYLPEATIVRVDVVQEVTDG